MKTKHLFDVVTLCSLLFIVGMSACDDSEEPTPTDVNQPDTTIVSLPGGLPGNPPDNNPPGNDPGNGNGPLGGGSQPPAGDETALGTLNIDGDEYRYTRYSFQAESQPADDGAYLIFLLYADEAAVADGESFQLFDDGNTAALIYRAEEPGVIEPGRYALEDSPFEVPLFGLQDYGYALAEGDITVENTETDGLLFISVEGYAEEVIEVNGSLQASPNADGQVIIQSGFFAFAQIDLNARLANDMNIEGYRALLQLSDR